VLVHASKQLGLDILAKRRYSGGGGLSISTASSEETTPLPHLLLSGLR